MKIAAYVRVSTDDQNENRQMRAIREKYEPTFRTLSRLPR
jgi:DNA invertase Pin-like site-specific DNA recombinase